MKVKDISNEDAAVIYNGNPNISIRSNRRKKLDIFENSLQKFLEDNSDDLVEDQTENNLKLKKHHNNFWD